MLEFIFGKKKTPEQMASDYQNIIKFLIKVIGDNIDEDKKKVIWEQLIKKYPDYLE